MVNFVNVPNTDDSDFSDTISNIDFNKSIVLCTNTYEKNIIYDKSCRVSFISVHPIPFTNYTTINEFTLFDYVPKVKICHPIGVNVNFIEPYDMPYYNKIYTLNDRSFNSKCILHSKVRTIIYLDRAIFKHTKKPLAIPKNKMILSLDFSYNINATEQIENIYYIQDTFVYDDFLNHFDRFE